LDEFKTRSAKQTSDWGRFGSSHGTGKSDNSSAGSSITTAVQWLQHPQLRQWLQQARLLVRTQGKISCSSTWRIWGVCHGKRKRNEYKLEELGQDRSVIEPSKRPLQEVSSSSSSTTATGVDTAKSVTEASVVEAPAPPSEYTEFVINTVSDIPSHESTGSFGHCCLNDRCKDPKRSLTEKCPGCSSCIHSICGRGLFMDEAGYMNGGILCPSCDWRADPAALCSPLIQCNEDSSENEGGRVGREEEEEEHNYISDEDQCFCGCWQDASGISGHCCLYSLKWVLPSCYHPVQEINEEDGSKAYCLWCFGKLAWAQNESGNDEEEGAHDNEFTYDQHCKQPLLLWLWVRCMLSNNYCIHTGKRVMALRFYDSGNGRRTW
jgi:hypothetical protein